MQHFSQKYTILQLLETIPDGMEFSANEWPLHVTIADTFAIDWDESLLAERLTEMLHVHPPAESIVEGDAYFGEDEQVHVMLLRKTPDLLALHMDVIKLLEQGGWKPNNPQFAKDGFLPHSTIRDHARLYEGDTIRFTALSLIDMFPDKDPYRRRVVKTIPLKGNK
ncbi:MAG TPA: 2'-5' RNA ligase family protein [Candidatus Saccharimonadales bacterium]|nr:2'-5' RNA ligase family protein [Candidatus Saccharimonadales bacterium]